MNKLYLKLLLFLSPFILHAILIIIVDPYNFLNYSHLIPDRDKKLCLGRTMETTPRGNICWKVLEYERNPLDYVLIGDSRMAHINNSITNEIIGENVYNFTIPGGNFHTLKDIFWIVSKNKNLKEVYIQLVFLNFSNNVNYDLMENIEKFQASPISYLYNKNIIFDTWVNVYYQFTKNDKFVDIEEREKDVDLWKRADKIVNDRLTKFDYSEEFARDLEKMAAYCTQNNINLYFILPPTYSEFIGKVKQIGLEKEYSKFDNLLHYLGKTIDLDTMKNFCSNSNNFEDYFHYQDDMLDSVTRVIWKEVKLAKTRTIEIRAN